MTPVIAIVGRPNVGKSTLFNHLTRTRNALVADYPGLTRDRHYGDGRVGDKPFIVIDTGGLNLQENDIEASMEAQAWSAVHEANIILFMVDARAGLINLDFDIAKKLRMLKDKKIYLVVNKTDGLQEEVATAEFYRLGIGALFAIAASHGRGVLNLIQTILLDYEEQAELVKVEDNNIKFAVVGRPNVGKSTLVNRMLGEDRVIVFDEAGTTRDSIFIPFERQGHSFTIIDTAGVRKKGKVHETVEKFSIIKTLQSIKEAQVVILLIDAQSNVTDQDLHLLGFILEAGKALIIAVNKWDGLEGPHREEVKATLKYRLSFAEFAPTHYISALHGSGVGNLFDAVLDVYGAATRILSTSRVNDVLKILVEKHPPPLVQNRRIKLRYAHSGGHNPPIIVIHGNQTERVPESYKRYLASGFRDALDMAGTPIRVEFKSSENPFAGRKNLLTPRQKHTRERLRKMHKKL